MFLMGPELQFKFIAIFGIKALIVTVGSVFHIWEIEFSSFPSKTRSSRSSKWLRLTLRHIVLLFIFSMYFINFIVLLCSCMYTFILYVVLHKLPILLHILTLHHLHNCCPKYTKVENEFASVHCLFGARIFYQSILYKIKRITVKVY